MPTDENPETPPSGQSPGQPPSGGFIVTTNDGPLILSSTYWGSPAELAGKLWCSVNAGTIRLLIPRSNRRIISDIRSCAYVILSRGPWPEHRAGDAFELLFEDKSDAPYAIHLLPNSFDQLPAEPVRGEFWTLTVWDSKKNRPHLAMSRRCHYRRVAYIPWGKPL